MSSGRNVRLLAVGSILHFAQDDDVVWGSGVNGKVVPERHVFSRLDVRAVRGPRTRHFLLGRSVPVPTVYGDPALLVAHHRPDLLELRNSPQHRVTIVPNLNDLGVWRADQRVLDPRSPLETCLRRIATSELVVGSSLHATIIAEALGIPAQPMISNAEDPLKYLDYFEGTGRPEARLANGLSEALRLGGQAPLRWDARPLCEAFPSELWSSGKSLQKDRARGGNWPGPAFFGARRPVEESGRP